MFTPFTAALLRFCCATLGFLIAHTVVLAQAASSALATPPPGQSFKGILAASELDADTFAEWSDGKERPLDTSQRVKSPGWVMLTTSTVPGFNGLEFGTAPAPGTHHLRIGFTRPVAAGTVLANGGGVLSVLKAGVAYPGDLNNEAHWTPALRPLADGSKGADPVGKNEYALWTLPPGTVTRALRFTARSQPIDLMYQGWLGGVLVTEERLVNHAPYAAASTRSGNRFAERINNGRSDGGESWENREKKKAPDGANEPPVSATNAEWIVLTWPASVKLGGLAAFWSGFDSVDVQTYTGPADRHPRDATDRDWQAVATFSGLQHGYAVQLWPNRLSFGREITTRALRLRIVAPITSENHPHLAGSAMSGRRVWLGELMALESIGTAPIESVRVVAAARASAPNPPIPVKFTLDRPGYVTLVIERPDGVRVRNLVSETFFPAGENTAWWDGTDDLGRDIEAARHGIYHIPDRFVEPGEYRVRGLVHDKIKPVYEFSVYTTGYPPWDTADHTGAWLANHSPPSAAVFVPPAQSPTGEPAVYLGSYVSEGPDGLAWVDLDGRKRGGKRWIGGIWTAAPYLARDAGAKAVAGVRVYAASMWLTNKDSGACELRLNALTAGDDKPVLIKPIDPIAGPVEDKTAPVDGAAHIGGLAANDGVIVVSLPTRNRLLFVRASDGQVLGLAKVTAPRGLAFDASGRLLVLSGRQLLRFDLTEDPARLGAGTPVVSTGLEEPVALVLDETGRIFVSDRGASHQVKIFTADGRPGGVIGLPGAPKAGPYEPLRLHNPAGIAIDSKRQLWVTEEDYLPKRVSVWTLDGKLVRAFYGPGKYGGGGALDPQDKNRFYYGEEGHGAMEFTLDWAKGSYALSRVYYRPAKGDMKLAFRSAGPERVLNHEGRRYFTNAYNSSPTAGESTAFLFIDRDGIARPVAAMGRANSWDLLKEDRFRPLWPEGIDLASNRPYQNLAFFIWNDLNDDAQAQPDEVAIAKGDGNGVTVQEDLSFCIARLDGKALRFRPVAISQRGVPRYELARSEVLATGVQHPASSGGNQVLVDNDGWAALTLGIDPFSAYSFSGARGGVAKWSYPNLWPGLHASHEAPMPDHPGQLIGPTRLLGGLMKSKAGPIWAVNSNHGCFYVFTSDGLFVTTVFEDMRQGTRWHMPYAKRGMSLEGLTMHDENFWPTITQLADGTVYLIDGNRSSLVRIDGLDTLRRLPDASLVLSKGDLEKGRAHLLQAEAARQKAEGQGMLSVAGRRVAPAVDGNVEDWAGAGWVDIDKRGESAYFNSGTKPYDVTGAVAVAAGRLYAAWRTGDAKLPDNSGEMPIAPFKTGGALELMIGANPNADPARGQPVPGDARLLVAVVNGKPRALLYRAVVPGTADSAKVPFSSPWRTITFDRVDDVTADVEFAGAGGNFEISVSLSLLQLRPAAGMIIKGDIGILRGQAGQTTARIYWANKATGITADVPSEAMLTPGLWGKWEFKPE